MPTCSPLYAFGSVAVPFDMPFNITAIFAFTKMAWFVLTKFLIEDNKVQKSFHQSLKHI